MTSQENDTGSEGGGRGIVRVKGWANSLSREAGFAKLEPRGIAGKGVWLLFSNGRNLLYSACAPHPEKESSADRKG